MRLLAVGFALLAGCAPVPVPRAAPYHASDADLSVTRIVHGSLLLAFRGTRLLVDPWFYSGFVVRQREPLGMIPSALPPVDAVLITHAHADHYDARTVRELAGRVPVAVAPRELHDRLVGLGLRQVIALDWWQRAQVGATTITAVPAGHGVHGYVLGAGGLSVYVAGDTRPGDALDAIAAAFPRLDAALLPVGGLRLLGFAREMGPEDAARAAAHLRPERVIPVGYGAAATPPLYWYASEPVKRFTAACKRLGVDSERIVVLEPGESWHYSR
jgi:L-ascorbate metabolism protein UlaG (beta-lactamase superfamily)